tara:strand:- start:94 stop:456 length:363 start_codon:yes stop_codon:yes gene_type:complete
MRGVRIDENKKAMLFTLNEHSQWLLSKALPRTKSRTVDRALKHYHDPGPPGLYVEVDELPEGVIPVDARIVRLHTNRKAYDAICDALTRERKRVKELDEQIEELLKAKKKRRFFPFRRSK